MGARLNKILSNTIMEWPTGKLCIPPFAMKFYFICFKNKNKKIKNKK